jgi:hypothetical protein
MRVWGTCGSSQLIWPTRSLPFPNFWHYFGRQPMTSRSTRCSLLLLGDQLTVSGRPREGSGSAVGVHAASLACDDGPFWGEGYGQNALVMLVSWSSAIGAGQTPVASASRADVRLPRLKIQLRSRVFFGVTKVLLHVEICSASLFGRT